MIRVAMAVLVLLVVTMPAMAATNEEINAYVKGCLKDVSGQVTVNLETFTVGDTSSISVDVTNVRSPDPAPNMLPFILYDMAESLKDIGTVYPYPQVFAVYCHVKNGAGDELAELHFYTH